MSENELTPQGLGCLIIFGLIIAGIYWGFIQLDSWGLIPQSKETVITAQGNWVIGENKQCWSPALDSVSARAINKENGYSFSKITCDGGPEHNIKVTFFGREKQPDYKVVFWNCTRNDTSFFGDVNAFTCKQTSAY